MEDFTKPNIKIQQILSAEPEIKIEDSSTDFTRIDVLLPYACRISGIIHQQGGSKELYSGNFDVPKDFQRHGIGERLLNILIQEAKKYDAKVFRGRVIGQDGFRRLIKLFGKENVHIHKASPSNPEVLGERLELNPDDIKEDNISYDLVSFIR